MTLLRSASLSLLLGSAGALQAQQTPPVTASFVALDQSGDGSVTHDEIITWARNADRDRDGKLSREEFATSEAAVKERREAILKLREEERDQRIRAKFASADRNGDGVWDRSEIAQESRRHFEMIDTAINNDQTGKLRHEIKTRGKAATEADYLAHHTTILAAADSDKDGRITVAEYTKWSKDAETVAMKSVKVYPRK
jgi:Ca2+-binding EF-hand superfamily protein